MDKKLQDQLISKYEYMFAEMGPSIKKEEKHHELMHRYIEAKANNNEDEMARVKSEQEATGSYYPIAYGICCDDGWYTLLDELMKNLSEADTSKKLRIHQIKEKFAGLRFYINDSAFLLDSETFTYEKDYSLITQIISEYENKSHTICELCGKPGKVCGASGWLKTVCNDHREYTNSFGNIRKYVPLQIFEIDTNIVTPEKKVASITAVTFSEEKDTYICSLDDGTSYEQEALERVPRPRLNVGWFVKHGGTEFVVTQAEYNAKDGWVYTVEFDAPVLNVPAIKLKEDLLEVVYTIVEGHRQIKMLDYL